MQVLAAMVMLRLPVLLAQSAGGSAAGAAGMGGAGGAASGAGGGGHHLIVWAIILLGLAIALFIIEVLIPSAGILGTASAICAVIGVVLLFQVDTLWGLIGAIVALAALPFAIGFALKIWPDTPLGRMLMLESQPPHATPDAEGAAPTPADRSTLVGRTGRAITDLRPVGTCLIDGRREVCLAQRGVIEAGRSVRVVSADGMRIKVQALS